MRVHPQLDGMFDDADGSLPQNRLNVWLAQNDVYFNKPVRGSDLQLLFLPTERKGHFNSEDFPARTLYHVAILVLCLSQTCHFLSPPNRVESQRAPPLFTAALRFLTVVAVPGGELAPVYTWHIRGSNVLASAAIRSPRSIRSGCRINARFVAALKGMWGIPGQTDERGAGDLLTGAIGGDAGEVAFEPNIGLVAGVTVVSSRAFPQGVPQVTDVQIDNASVNEGLIRWPDVMANVTA